MTYAVKAINYTLQGEGANTGKPAVLLRFAGCNLWSGKEEDRATASCQFCDTDFEGVDGPGGGKYTEASHLADAVDGAWPAVRGSKFVLCTGGEPLLQLDADLLTELRARNFFIAIETNGTIAAPAGIDWICVSPKAGTKLVQTAGDELKLVYPQEGLDPATFEHLEFAHLFLQPLDGPDRKRNTELAIEYCLGHPGWRLSLQMHKIVGIP
jgi:7-carboxy-7-deazaguanine synthase (Cx14CxxC type)